MSVRAAQTTVVLSRAALLTGVSALVLLLAAPMATARPLGGKSAPASPAAAVAGAQAGAMEAARAAQRAQNALSRTTRAIQAMQASQAAARGAARLIPGGVPNGLRPGGLQVAPGAVPGSTLWQGADLPTEVIAGGHSEVTVKQNQQKAILTWKTFNIGTDTTLHFDQRAGTAADGSNNWVALNRVLDPQAAPSKILGAIKAPGQVYVINQNGIIFGGASQVNVGTLVASTLNITDATFKGALADTRWDQFEIPVFGGYNVGSAGDVRVERGALIVAHDRGRVMLLAQNVANSGEIRADDGQVALVAGRSVVMRASDTSNLRGFEFEINTRSGGTTTNDGLITARRGNISLVGLDVAQNGVATSTTSVLANGSITLHARDGFTYEYSTYSIEYGRTGSVILGDGSLTSIRPELDDPTTLATAKLTDRSMIDIVGRQIRFGRDSLVQATGGDVAALAVVDSAAIGSDLRTRIFMEEGAWIDVSGVLGASAPSERSVVKVELRGPELKDSPLHRRSFLYGRSIYVDTRQSGSFSDDLMKGVEWFKGEPGKWYGTPLADVSGYIGLVRRGIGELSAAGGTIKLQSSGDLVTKAGSLLTASGGAITYTPGYANTTRLVAANGRMVNIGDADPAQTYIGIAGQFTRQHGRWGVSETWTSPLAGGRRYDPGYTQGGAGGTINLTAPRTQLSGAMNAAAGVGDRDRDAITRGGSLVLGNDVVNPNRAVRVGDVRLQAQTPAGAVAPDFTDPTPLPNTPLVLSTDMLSQGGFGNLEIYSSGKIEVAADAVLTLPARGTVSLAGANVTIDGTIISRSGTIRLSTLAPAATSFLNVTEPRDITVGRGAVLDVSGLWVNDLLDREPTLPLAIDGGRIEILAPGYAAGSRETPNFDVGVVTVARGSVLNVTGGGQLTGKGTLKAGNGGSLTVRGKELHLDGTVSAEAMGKGGTLSLTARQIQVGGTAPADTLQIDPSLFRQGFGAYVLNGYDSFVVAPGTRIEATRTALTVADTTLPSGTPLAFTPLSIAAWPAANLSFSATRPVYDVTGSRPGQVTATGTLEIGTGADIRTAAGGSVSLTAGRLVTVDGTVTAHGGRIDVSLAEAAQTVTNPGQSIWLLSGSTLDVSGTAMVVYDPRDLTRQPDRSVLNGGTVRISDNARGIVVTQAGSVIDVSGGSGIIEVPSLQGMRMADMPATVYSDAGMISVAARGMSLNGSYRAAAGSSTTRRGTLSLFSGDVLLPSSNTGTVEVLAQAPTAPTVRPGAALDLGNKASVAAAALADAGFDAITLQAGAQVMMEGGTRLAARRSIVIAAPQLAVGASDTPAPALIEAGHVSLANARDDKQNHAGEPTAGDGMLRVKADLLDITGNVTLMGIDRAHFDVAGDVRLTGVTKWTYDPVVNASKPSLVGRFATAGDLDITAAQIYPTVLSNYTLASTTSIAVHANGNAHPVPLSAGGGITLAAPAIMQAGVIRAPMGAIRFDAGTTGTVTLAPGSLTSVATEGTLLPMGRVRNGRTWYLGDVVGNPTGLIDMDMPPEKRIEIAGQQIDMQAGSRLDVSGGGDISAFEWVPGPGGSRDILASQPGAPVFAVLPHYAGVAAPADSVASTNTGLNVGDAVYLDSVPGLSAGWYTLLPGHYALMPGAFRVTIARAAADVPAGFASRQADGTFLVASRFGVAGLGVADSRTSLLRIMPADVLRTFSEYRDYTGQRFFTQVALDADRVIPRLAVDAGQVILSATQALRLDGSISFAPGKDGRGGLLDIAAESIAIIGASGQPVAGYGLNLRGDELSRMGAESLLLGGRRTQTADGVKITPLARQILVANDSAAVLVGPEIMFAAGTQIVDGQAVDGTGTVTFARGSAVHATGTYSGRPGGTITIGNAAAPGSTTPLPPGGTGMGVLVIASTAAPSRIVRRDIAAADGPVRGVLDIQDGAVLHSDGRLVLDATGDMQLASGAVLRAKALDAASSAVSFGAVPNGVTGLVLSSSTLAALSAVSDLTLRSYGTMDFWGATDIGGAGLTRLTLDAGAFVQRASGDVSLHAVALDVRNSSGTVAAGDDPAAAGTLRLQAGTITIDAGQSATRGFGAVILAADREIVFAGRGGFTAGTAAHAADLTLSAPRLTAKGGADQAAVATGGLTTIRTAVPADLGAITLFGGALALRGARVFHGGTIDMPAGTLRLEATGNAAADGVTVAGASVISVKAFRKAFFDQEAFASAGTVELKAASGTAVVESGALIDLSATDGGNAGTLRVNVPKGTLILAGDVRAGAKAGATRGSFTLDTGTLSDIGALMATLNAGSFFEQRLVTVRSGDVALDGTAQARNLQVTADTGRIIVRSGARLLADSDNGGSVRLVARDDLILDGGALIAARGSKGKGGRIDLETASGALDLAAGSTLDVSGATLGGKVHVRAARTGEVAGTIKARHLDSTVVGALGATAEAFWAYDGVATIDRALIDRVTSAANTFMAQAPARLGAFDLAAGIELRSAGDMTLAADWDLHATRPGGKPGFLTLRAAGNLTLAASLSDGFDGITARAALLADESWSYRLIGGARLDAADVFSLRQPADLAAVNRGDVIIAPNAIVRTGTGDIQVRAGRSVILQRQGGEQIFNPENPSQIINLSQAVTPDGLALQTQYESWLKIAGDTNYIFDPNNPSTAVDFARVAFRPDGRLNTTYRGWRSVSGLDIIYDPADPSRQIRFLDAFDASGALLPAYRGWRSLYANDAFTAQFSASWRSGGGRVADVMEVFLPNGMVDLRYLGWFIKPGTTTVVCRNAQCANHPTNPALSPQDISAVMNTNGTIKPMYASWRSSWDVWSTTIAGVDNDHEGVVYTAGRLSAAGTLAIQSTLPNASYAGTISLAEKGGDLTIVAQQDVQGPKLFLYGCASWSATCDLRTFANRQYVADWLLRRGGYDANGQPLTAWGVDFAKFTQGVGTLGGGDVSVAAGGRISALTAVASDNGKVTGSMLQTWGGGDLTVTAGGNADGNLFYVANGRGNITAGGSIGMLGVPNLNSYNKPLQPVGTMLALGRGRFDVSAHGDISIGGMFNPTLVGMEGNATGSSDPNFNATPGTPDGTYFSTYATDSALDVQSAVGRVTMSAMPDAVMKTMSKLGLGYGSGAAPFFFYAPRVRVVSLQSDIVVGRDYIDNSAASGRMTLWPAQNGNLTLLAAHDIDLTANANSAANSARGNNILVSDADPAQMPGVFNPGTMMFDDLLDRLTEVIASNESGSASAGMDKGRVHARTLYRALDTDPVRIYALEGSILSSPIAKSNGNGIQIVVPKPAIVRAGKDIRNLIFAGQNFNAGDVTVVEAGRDIVFEPYTFNRQTGNAIQIGGPGRLEVSAGRHVRLASSDGIQTVGNGFNPWLTDGVGAKVAVTTGTAGRIAYDAFAERYLNPAGTAGVERHYGRDLVAFMEAETGRSGLSESAAWTLFRALPEVARRELVRQVLFKELAFVGRREAPKPVPQRNYNDGYDAIALLFPDKSYVGDIDMFYSQIKTLDGGGIDLVVPGGKIDIGLTFVTPDINGGARFREPGDLGLMTLWGGGINTFSAGSVLVNQNRIKTLGGGDIVMWSSAGDIDAGRGAKTAQIAPRPETVYDPTVGSFTTRLAGEAAGSGIGTVKSRPDVPAGDVVLMAPRGTVDAGDAGIQSSGTVVIAALIVRNADNIQSTGVQIGVPNNAVDTGALTQASNASAAATPKTEPKSSSASERPSIILVEVLGYGGGTGEPSPGDDERRRKAPDQRSEVAPPEPIQVVGYGPLTPSQTAALTEAEKRALSGQ
ncbi:filamentous haemagglutinin family protein [Reyranella sp. CPCC 100927]|uniref:filamentous haemagglutinin family protein n=1 Tax=Reyranella sp. CPCC 100927 TaxID=2599616 RepID=UPI0011B85226|nr:filamentous haemagglutinin family protein [Reyranella sp. CPCC 100927]TWT13050.1 filamentous hemagglutinin N-terminal domain-containing protein [Reyranella sp. CPCC 100927]